MDYKWAMSTKSCLCFVFGGGEAGSKSVHDGEGDESSGVDSEGGGKGGGGVCEGNFRVVLSRVMVVVVKVMGWWDFELCEGGGGEGGGG